MANIINEEMNKMLYLFGYKRGLVISEQTIQDELDEAGRPKKDVIGESNKIFDRIYQNMIENGVLMFNDYFAISKKYKNTEKLKTLLARYADKLKKYDNLTGEEKNRLKDKIFQKAESDGDVPYEDSNFILKFYKDKYDYLKTLFSYENPFNAISKKEKEQNLYNKVVMTKKITNDERRYLSLNADYLLNDLYNKGIIEKPKTGKMSADENQNFEKLINLFNIIKSQNNITVSQNSKLSVLRRKLKGVLDDNYYSEINVIRNNTSRRPGLRITPQEKENEYKRITDFVINNKDIWVSDYNFLKNSNEELFNKLKDYWSKYTPKPKPVVPEPVVVPVPEPPLVNEPVNRGVRGRRPSTPEQIKNRIEDIKSKFSENNKLDDKDYQFLYKNDPELLKTIVRPKKRKPKMDFKLNPEEIDYEPMGKLGDYWTTSTTGDYDVNYNSK